MSKKILRPLLTVAGVGLTIFGGPLGVIPALGLKIGVGALAGLALGAADGEPLRSYKRALFGGALGAPVPIGMRPYHRERERGRFAMLRLEGDCMVPMVPVAPRLFALIDHQADIEPGDLIALATKETGRVAAVKRFITWTETGFEVECLNPYTQFDVPREEVIYAYRVAEIATSRLALIRTATRILWRAEKARARARAEAWSAKLGLSETASASAVPHRDANNG